MTENNLKTCLIIGNPVDHSLSPLIQNSGLKALSIEDQYSYGSRQIEPSELADFIAEARKQKIHGITVTIPHKQTIMPLLDSVDSVAEQIGAVNTVVNQNGVLTGYNTDYIGAIKPLLELSSLKNKNVAVIGAGGAAKAFVYGLVKEGAKVTIYNRTEQKAKDLADKFGCAYSSLDDQSNITRADIICNASSAGFDGSGSENKVLIEPKYLKPGQIVFDAVYAPLKTKLLKDAQAAGAQVIYGSEMLLHQGFVQFEYFTGRKAPEEKMRKALMEQLHALHI